jgi:hypothetical protein
MRKGVITMGVFLGFLLSLVMVTGAIAAKDEIVFNTSNGDVKFTHKKHSETLKIDCLKCHHTWKKGDTSGKVCNECHKEKAEGKTLSAKDAFQGLSGMP